jgi:hypothetical protein
VPVAPVAAPVGVFRDRLEPTVDDPAERVLAAGIEVVAAGVALDDLAPDDRQSPGR